MGERKVGRRVMAQVAEPVVSEGKALRPAQCRSHMRKTLAAGYRDIVASFVKEAKTGSCAHMKLATELLGTSVAEPKRRGKGPAATLLEEWGGRRVQ